MWKYILGLAIAAALAFGVYFTLNHKQQQVKKQQRQTEKPIEQPIETPQEGQPMEESTSAKASADKSKKEFVTLDSGLKYIVLKEGSGAQAKDGDTATVHYTGWLYDPNASEFKGQKFDSSVDRGQPFQFGIGAGMVIRGWDEGVALMKEGEKRTFILPAELAYGSNAVGGIIPANATLVFDVELLKLN